MRIVEIFSGTKREEMYLYVDRQEGTQRVPDALLQQFGTLRSVMTLPLTEDRRLARVESRAVLAGIVEQGYYLQLPPSADALAEQQIAAMIEAEQQLQQRQDGQPPQN